MVSLRKAADPQWDNWTFGEIPENRGDLQTLEFTRPRSGGYELVED